MALVQSLSEHLLDLTGGAQLEPGETANVDPDEPHEAAMIADGLLLVIDPDLDPPTVPFPTRLARVYVGSTDPGDGAILWIKTDGDGLVLDVIYQGVA